MIFKGYNILWHFIPHYHLNFQEKAVTYIYTLISVQLINFVMLWKAKNLKVSKFVSSKISKSRLGRKKFLILFESIIIQLEKAINKSSRKVIL